MGRDVINLNFRIRTNDGKIKYAGTGQDSWFTLERARALVNRSIGEVIIEYSPITGRELWEVC